MIAEAYLCYQHSWWQLPLGDPVRCGTWLRMNLHVLQDKSTPWVLSELPTRQTIFVVRNDNDVSKIALLTCYNLERIQHQPKYLFSISMIQSNSKCNHFNMHLSNTLEENIFFYILKTTKVKSTSLIFSDKETFRYMIFKADSTRMTIHKQFSH